MANENIGEIDCPFCMGRAFVRQSIKGKLYIYCDDDGIIQPTKPNFQHYIKEHCEMYATPEADYNGGGEPEPEQLAEPEPKPEAVAEKDKPTKSGFLTNFWGDDE